MTDTVGRRRPRNRGRVRDLVSKAIAEHIVADAPDDYDEVLQSVPVASDGVRVLAFLAALSISWALAIVVSVALCGGGSHARPRRPAPGASPDTYVRRESPASGMRPA